MPDDEPAASAPGIVPATAAELWFPVGAGSPAKLTPPPSDDEVARSRLLSWFSGLSGSPAVLVTAPAGYGKTTMLRQWTAADERPVAWLTLDDGDNDPALLLGYLAAALEAAGPIDAAVLSGPLSESVFFEQVALPRFARAVRELQAPVLLALDEVQSLETAAAWRLLSLTVENLPDGSAAVLSGRAEPAGTSFSRVSVGDVARVRKEDLAFSLAEGTALLDKLGVALPPADVTQLLAKTEGWPAAVYLAGLSLRTRSDPSTAVDEFSGGSAVVVDYLREEFLGRSEPDLVRFLTRTSVLDRLSGPLCDEVLGAHDSGALLTRISRANLLLSPLDGSASVFRYHRLFAEMLGTELRRLEPQLESTLHARASAWFERNGDPSAAISHARAAGDSRRAAELLWFATPGHITTGRRATVERWLAACEPHDLVTDPLLGLASAWCALSSGQPAEPWLVTAELALERAQRPVTKGMSATGAVAILRAILRVPGAVRMARDAERTYELEPPDSPARPVACYLAGVAHHLLAHRDEATEWLEAGRDLARRHRTPTFWALCAAQLGVVAAGEQDWARCVPLVQEAMELVHDHGLDEFPTMVPVFAASAHALAHGHHLAQAEQMAAHAHRLLGMTGQIGPWLLVETRTVLARVEVLLGAPAAGAALLSEAERDLARVPDAPALHRQIEQLRILLRAPGPDRQVGNLKLTVAEQRVVRMLSTHLSFGEIAAELDVSKNTVKTQAISAYRKLGVNSRSAAVDAARTSGLTA